MFSDLGVSVNLVLPENCSVEDLKALPKAWFNFVPYRETGIKSAEFLEKKFNMPFFSIAPIGVLETANFIKEVARILTLETGHEYTFDSYIEAQIKTVSRASWFARSIDCQNRLLSPIGML